MSESHKNESGCPQPDPSAAAHAACGHPHAPDVDYRTGTRLLLTLGLNLLIPVAQIIGGVMANSMALISDATHNFSDFAAILIAFMAYRIARRGVSVRNTFGYRRAEVLAALINVGLLAGAAVVIVVEAVERVRHPAAVAGGIVMGLAAVGILGNGFSAWLLHRDAKRSLNVRGAFWHMVGDMLTSVAVLVSGAIMYVRPWYWLDPVLSFAIVVFILKNCWGIAREAGLILMNSTPRHIDLEKVRHHLQELPGVLGVHYLHAWQVSSGSVAFSCHVVVPDQAVSRTEPLAENIRRDLLDSFGIDHPVLQFETAACGNGDLLCQLSCGNGNGARASQ
ncbi:MAG: cation diffusion facilitator family transporter [Desulfobacterales bacterium]|nr:cation diffusion facilitator family transporter [Desulfobacterales bacterium]